MPGDERLVQNAPIAALVAAACAAHGVPLFHGSSTSVYADETPYAESKRASEEAAAGATMLRFHFPYGPGQRRGAIPTMLRQALAGEPVVVYRGWERSFCFARDAAEAVVLLVERGERGAWDVGRDDDRRTLEEIARLACRAAARTREPDRGRRPASGAGARARDARRRAAARAGLAARGRAGAGHRRHARGPPRRLLAWLPASAVSFPDMSGARHRTCSERPCPFCAYAARRARFARAVRPERPRPVPGTGRGSKRHVAVGWRSRRR